MGFLELDKIRIVDHRAIFRDHLEALPTFNSRSIEAMLYRIPGLAEQYVYFNDDMSLIKPVGPEHFFGPNGPVLRGYYDVMPHYRIKRRVQKFLTDTFGIRNAYLVCLPLVLGSILASGALPVGPARREKVAT